MLIVISMSKNVNQDSGAFVLNDKRLENLLFGDDEDSEFMKKLEDKLKGKQDTGLIVEEGKE